MSPRQPFVPRAPVLVAGEGDDECSFVDELCKQHAIRGIQTFPYDGRNSLPDFLQAARPQLGAVRVLVVVRDADMDPPGAFASVTGHLKNASLAVPDANGTIATGTPSTAVWLLPSDQHEGTLETACWDALGDHHERPCVEQFIKCVEKARGSSVSDSFKAPIRAWLATRERAETRVGLAAKLGSLPLAAKTFEPFVEFLRAAAQRAVSPA